MNSYRAYYRGREIAVKAATSLAAQQAAAVIFRARHAWQVTVILADAAGKPAEAILRSL